MTDPTLPAGWAGLRVLVLSPTPTHPLDFGNRKRIYHVCADLKARGAEVHFVHYASEADWRGAIPAGALAAMQACWDSVWTVPVTRPLHMPPAGQDHTADEWWDPAIGDMLRWLFSADRFDVLLVNYTWMSKALEVAPRGVFRILDTHDRFSDRRALLEANGLPAEYFHTTVEEERTALARADMVWAIKDQEEAFFRGLGLPQVCTLPYVEPLRPLGRSVPPRGILRFGIVGARNNVNLANIRAFLEVARHFIERTLLPCEIHIAGSCCIDLAHDRHPVFVKLIGRVPEMADFYRQVDAVLAPMTFSTGLKIKVGEALNHGKALIAHAHAFEGYKPTHDFHQLPDFKAMMWACRQVVAQPELIETLEDASVRSSLHSLRQTTATLDATAVARTRLPAGLCLVLDIADVASGSLRFDHVCEVGKYLGWLGPVCVLLGGQMEALPDTDALYRLNGIGELALTPELAGRSADTLSLALERRNLRVRTLDGLGREGHYAAWFAGGIPQGTALPARSPMVAIVAQDPIMQGGTDLPPLLAALGAAFSRVVLLSRQDGPEPSAARRTGVVEHLRVPMLYKGHQSYAVWALERSRRQGLAILADDGSDPLVDFTLAACRRLSQKDILILVPKHPGFAAPDGANWAEPASFFRSVWDQRSAPALIFDTGVSCIMDGLRETFDRQGLARIALFRQGSTLHQPVGMPVLEAAGAYASLELLGRAVRDPLTFDAAARRRAVGLEEQNDAGWAILWSMMDELRRNTVH